MACLDGQRGQASERLLRRAQRRPQIVARGEEQRGAGVFGGGEGVGLGGVPGEPALTQPELVVNGVPRLSRLTVCGLRAHFRESGPPTLPRPWNGAVGGCDAGPETSTAT
ncbi:hypothetical protein GCM10017744_027600 [Streptomyces antimycoticus]|uniref:Uncharacterized protein n=1 Tax=Streptomyces antimycoticus TaxID=68175 RepID=A0A4D4KEL3_9ACTN|nr:hypothetical protein SANT12839_074760 [Streptomyces antimycoticus]